MVRSASPRRPPSPTPTSPPVASPISAHSSAHRRRYVGQQMAVLCCYGSMSPPDLHASARSRARSRRPSQRKAKPHGRTQPADRRGASRFGKRTPVIPIPPLLAKRTNSIFVPSGTWAGTRERRHKAGSRSSRATLAAALTLQCWRPRSARWRSSHVTKPSPRPYLRPHAPLSLRLAVSRALSAAVSPA